MEMGELRDGQVTIQGGGAQGGGGFRELRKRSCKLQE